MTRGLGDHACVRGPGVPCVRAGRSAYAILIGVLKTLCQFRHRHGAADLRPAPDQGGQRAIRHRGAGLAADYVDSLSMLNARFDGVDDEGRPFSLADEASQPSSVDEIVDLSLPKGDITLNDGTWLALTAKTGKYDRKATRWTGRGGQPVPRPGIRATDRDRSNRP